VDAERVATPLAHEALHLRAHRVEVGEHGPRLAARDERSVCAIAAIGERLAKVDGPARLDGFAQRTPRRADERDGAELREGRIEHRARNTRVVGGRVVERAVELEVCDGRALGVGDVSEPRELGVEGRSEGVVVEAHARASEARAIGIRGVGSDRGSARERSADDGRSGARVARVGATGHVDELREGGERVGFVVELAYVDVQSKRHRAVWSPPMTAARKPSRRSIALALSASLMVACGEEASAPAAPARTEAIPPSAQRSGDAAAGYEYLRYGDFIGAGVPVEVFLQFFSGAMVTNELERTGDNAMLPRAFNAFDMTLEGHTVRVVGGTTCFGCHASSINGRFIPGLGTTTANFTTDSSARVRLLDTLVRAQYTEDSPEWRAYLPFSRGAQAVGPFSTVPFQGLNGAFLLEDAAASHRDPLTLAWRDEPAWSSAPTPQRPRIASDTPAWWLLRKKNALYYNGMGRGDFARMLMQVSVVAVRDAAQAETILARFGDVLAWLRALRAPTFPGAIDATRAARGAVVFGERCASCHGTYGAEGVYPNLLVPVATVGTDAAYAEQFMVPGRLTDWFNRSWYAGTGSSTARMTPSRAYLAPPLDGVWATAPYLHNGSVPTLAALLQSATRPARWRRNFASSTYDMVAVGWPVTEGGAADAQTYDTTQVGYSNRGHTFGDALDDADRAALIEYLKTL
jgi:mono/diheme cytochrome c family protein